MLRPLRIDKVMLISNFLTLNSIETSSNKIIIKFKNFEEGILNWIQSLVNMSHIKYILCF